MGCVGLIRIICRISRTLFPPNHITKTDRKCQQNRIPPSFPCSHFYLHYDDNSSPAKLFSILSRTIFRYPTTRRAPTGRSPAFVSVLIWFSCSLGRGSRLSPPLENRDAAPAPPSAHGGSGAGRGEPPAPHTHAPAGKHPAGEGCQTRAGASKHFPKHSFWLHFLVLYEMCVFTASFLAITTTRRVLSACASSTSSAVSLTCRCIA